jgi:hypothetical protein
VDDDGVAAFEIGQDPPQLEGVLAVGRSPRRTGRDSVLVHDRYPPRAAASPLPKTEPQLDPTVAHTKTERRGGAVPALAGHAHVTAATAAVVVGARLSGSRREREHEQRQEQETGHGRSVRRARRRPQWDIGLRSGREVVAKAVALRPQHRL